MISRLDVQCFKALRDVRLELGQLNVIVGPNGSGKTSVLEAALMVSQAMLDGGDSWVARHWPPSSHTLGDARQLVVTAQMADCGFRLTMEAGIPTPRGQNPGWHAKLECMPDGHHWREWGSVASEQRDRLRDTFGRAALLRLDTTVMSNGAAQPIGLRTPQGFRGHSVKPSLDDAIFAGANLASELATVKLRDDEAFVEVEQALRSVVPFIRKIRMDRSDKGGEVFLFDTVMADRVPGHLMSEGTLLILALLTKVLSPSRPRIILLDDIDRALHPKAQRDLIALLRKFLEQHPDVQILATSHSPYLLDSLNPSEVRLTSLDGDGAAHVARLEDHPEFERWKDVMTPGEFWSTVGEDWITGSETTVTSE